MKSIDEFATDYAQDKYLPVQTSQAVKAGANYVLDVIEEMLALKNQYTNKCDFCDDLEWRIEQLKK